MKSKKFKVLCVCLLVLFVFIGLYHDAVWSEKVLVGRWYLINQEANTYSRSNYIEFYEDGSCQAGEGDSIEYGEWKVENKELCLRFMEVSSKVYRYGYEVEAGDYLTVVVNGDGETKETKFINADKADEW